MKPCLQALSSVLQLGNDGPDNEGLSGMGSSDLSVTVGATDDQNTIDREDDTIAGYSSRGLDETTVMEIHSMN